METAAVRSALDLTVMGPEVPVLVTAHLEYRSSDPYAVTALFDTGADEPVRWVFSRDLLDEGLVHDVGDGDVAVLPGQDGLGQPTVLLRLVSPTGMAVLEASADDVLEFLGRSYELVPPGEESRHLDIDGCLENLLAA